MMEEFEIKQKVLEYLEPLASEFIHIVHIRKELGFTFDTQILRAYLTNMEEDGYIEQPSNVQDYTHFRITGEGKLYLQYEGGYIGAHQIEEEASQKFIEQEKKTQEEKLTNENEEGKLRIWNLRNAKLDFITKVIALPLALYGLIRLVIDLIDWLSGK